MYRSLLLFGLMGSIMTVGQATGGQAGQATSDMRGMSNAQSTGTAASGAAAGQGTGGGMTTAQPIVVIAPPAPGLVENSGYVTTGVPIQGVVNPPLLEPPNAALPGSGPATGAPPSLDVNNSTRGGTGDVVFPGSGEVSPALNGAPPESPAPAGTKGDRARNGILNTGMGRFAGPADNASPSAQSAQSQMTVADVAREYKARRASDHPRVIDNSRIDSLSNHSQNQNNGSASPQTLPQSDNAAPSNPPPPQAALSQRDLAIVEAELARSRAASAAADSSNTTASNTDNGVVSAQDAANATAQPSTAQVDNSANAQATSQATAPTASTASQTRQHRSASANSAQGNAQANTQSQQQLPATASNLPLLGFIGLFAAGVGAIFAFRTRRE